MSNEQGCAEALLDAFLQVPRHRDPPPTFLQISGYPHYENVCSNILEFYLDPKNPHGLGTLFLDAIAQIGCIEEHQGMSANVEVTREQYTKNRKRIDILIRSDSHAVLIENKIFSPPDYNPFPDYAQYLDQMEQVTEGCKHKFLLTLKPVGDESASRIGHGFKNITYLQLVSRIRELVGGYVAKADTRYLTFMLDFLNTLDSLQGDMLMNPEFVELLHSRQGDVETLLEEIRAFKSELRSKRVNPLGQRIDVGSLSNYRYDVRQFKYREDGKLFDILVHEIDYPQNFRVAIDTRIQPEGWTIQIFPRDNDSVRRARLKDLLQSLSIAVGEKEEGESIRFVLQTQTPFEYGADLDEIATVVRYVVHKLATSEPPQLEGVPHRRCSG